MHGVAQKSAVPAAVSDDGTHGIGQVHDGYHRGSELYRRLELVPRILEELGRLCRFLATSPHPRGRLAANGSPQSCGVHAYADLAQGHRTIVVSFIPEGLDAVMDA